jgi:hypothetical protein
LRLTQREDIEKAIAHNRELVASIWNTFHYKVDFYFCCLYKLLIVKHNSRIRSIRRCQTLCITTRSSRRLSISIGLVAAHFGVVITSKAWQRLALRLLHSFSLRCVIRSVVSYLSDLPDCTL